MSKIKLENIKSEIIIKNEPDVSNNVKSDQIVKREPTDIQLEKCRPHRNWTIPELNRTTDVAKETWFSISNVSCLKSPAKNYVCDVCGKRSSTLQLLRKHIRHQHTKAATFCCTQCPKAFIIKSLLQQHINTVHWKIQKSCDICDFKTLFSSTLKRHRNAHSSRPGCHICRKPIAPSIMANHLLTHLKNYVKPLKSCEICGKLFSHASTVSHHWKKTHLTSHGPRFLWNRKAQESRILECDFCEMKLKTKQHLRYHMRLNHMEVKRHLSCNICDFKTSYQFTLKKHKRAHLEKPECPVCRKPFAQQFLPIHVATHSNKIIKTSSSSRTRNVKLRDKGPFECDKCSRVYMNRKSILNHFLKWHTVKRIDNELKIEPQEITTCPCCYKQFDIKALEKHIEKKHRRENFRCRECDEVFMYNELLRIHRLRKHFDGELHECDCGAVYRNKYDLKYHKKAHDSPITCEICHRIFTVQNSIYSHWKKRHHSSHGPYVDWKHSRAPKPQSRQFKKKSNKFSTILRREGPFICDCCEKVFQSRTSIVNHVKNHAGLSFQNQQLGRGPQFPTTCPCCYKTFDVKVLENHIKKKHRVQRFSCQDCDKIFMYQEMLRIHRVKTHYDGELHECNCGSVYMNKYDLNNHRKAHDPPITCAVCSRFFADKDSLRIHWKFCHSISHGSFGDWKKAQLPKIEKVKYIRKSPLFPIPIKQYGPYTCDFCGKDYINRNSIMSHVKYSHISTPLLLCELCPQSFNKNSLMKTHMQKFHKNRKSSGHHKKVFHSCTECGEAFPYKNELRKHILKTHYEGELFECQCGAVFKDKVGLYYHERIHKQGVIACELCDRKYKNASLFSTHWKTHHYETHGSRSDWKKSMGLQTQKQYLKVSSLIKKLNYAGPYTCDLCGRIQKSRVSMFNHLRYQHLRVNRLFCDLCPKSFNIKSLLKTHMSEYHLKEKITCVICGFQTVYKNSLRFHMRLHDKNRVQAVRRKISTNRIKSLNCSCIECGENFNSNSDRRRHTLKNHYDGILHECHCGELFKYKNGLEQHKQVHKKTELKCELCGFATKHSSSFSKHWKRKHLNSEGNYGTWKELMGIAKVHSSAIALNDDGLYACNQCSNVYSNFESIVLHIKHKHGKQRSKPRTAAKIEQPQVISSCPCCYKTFDIKALEKHIEKKHRRENFKCQECDEVFMYSELLRIHRLRKHFDGELHECDCGAVYKNKNDLNHHLKAHDPPITCDVCIRIFVDMESFYRHWRTRHFSSHGYFTEWKKMNGVKTASIKQKIQKFPIIIKQKGPYNCDFCDRQCVNRNSVMNHLRYTHFLKPYLNCEHCPEKFNMKSLLEYHVQRFHRKIEEPVVQLPSQLRKRKPRPDFLDFSLNPVDHTCKECGETFSLKRMLKRHFLNNHYAGEVHKCHCGAVFKQKQYLANHELIHTLRNMQCEICCKTLGNRSAFYEHWKVKHLKTHGSRSAWKESMGITRKRRKPSNRSSTIPILNHPGPYTCDVCGKNRSTRGSILTHLVYRHFKKNFLFCDLCPRSFNMKSLLEKHLKIHSRFKMMKLENVVTTDMMKRFNCLECGESFDYHSNFRNHLLKNHYKGQLYECHCGSVFKSKMSLRQHKSVHSNVKINCKLCGIKFKNKNIYNHWKLKHAETFENCESWKEAMGIKSGPRTSIVLNNKGPYTCDLCGHDYLNRSSILSHINSAHLNPKTKLAKAVKKEEPQVITSCPCCYKTFDVEALEKHIEKSHNKYNFRCRDCEEVFIYSEQLRIHVLKQHYDGELLECDCGAVFKDKYKLNQHMKAHDPPITCDICSRIFVDMDSLYRHWRQRHYSTHRGFGEWKKAQMGNDGNFEHSDFLIVSIKGECDEVNSYFDGHWNDYKN